MPLIDILQRYATITGVRLVESGSRAAAVDLINAGARKLYQMDDMEGCLYEQVFDFDLTNELVTLPWYVERLRGVRCRDSKTPLTLIDKRPRYQYGKYYQDTLDFRVKQKVSTTQDVTNESSLTFTIPSTNGEAFDVVVVGSTANKSKEQEVLSFSATDTTKTTTNSFVGFPHIRGIYKNKQTQYDVTVTDASSNVVATIPSHRKSSEYLLVQIRDSDFTVAGTNKCYEILFKWAYEELIDDYDEFVCPGFDDAIYHMALAEYYMKSKDPVENAKAEAEKREAKDVARRLNRDNNRAQEMRIETKPQGIYKAIRKIGYGRRFV